jgi:hypothetical protein
MKHIKITSIFILFTTFLYAQESPHYLSTETRSLLLNKSCGHYIFASFDKGSKGSSYEIRNNLYLHSKISSVENKNAGIGLLEGMGIGFGIGALAGFISGGYHHGYVKVSGGESAIALGILFAVPGGIIGLISSSNK